VHRLLTMPQLLFIILNLMELYKKTLLLILLLLLSVTLRSAVVYIDGWAAGKIISINNIDAYLLTVTSGKKQDQNILIAFNFSDNIIKWETPILGYFNTFVQITNDRLVTIESDTVIARNPQNGNINWKIDLRTISTGSQDVTPNEFKPHFLYARKKLYNRCIQEPLKAKWFDYTPFMPDANNVFLFRIARYHYDGPIPFEKDWVQIDLRSGDVIGKGCYALKGFSKNMAFITEYRDIYSLNGGNPCKISIQNDEDMHKKLTSPFYEYYFNENCVSSDWFFLFKGIVEQIKDVGVHQTSVDIIIFPQKADAFKKISIISPPDYYSKIVAAGDYLVQIATSQKSWSNVKQGVSWIEIYNLDGKLIQRKTDDVGESFKAEYLGQTQTGDILLKKGKVIERYSVPGLKLISGFKLEDNDDFVDLYGEFLFSEGDNGLVVAYLTGRIFDTVMKNRKNKQTVYFKFFNFKTGIKRATLKRKLTYFKKKHER
jgi:hypothetical protein